MPIPDVSRTHAIARSVSRVAGALAAAIAVVVLGGWAFHVAALQSFGFGAATTMRPNTALCVLFAGIALRLRCHADGRRAHTAARALAAAVLLIAGLTLAENALSLDMGIDRALFRNPSSNAGRMAPPTALALALLGSALLLPRGRRSVIAAQTLGLAAGVIAAAVLLGHLYGAATLYWPGGSAPVAPHTGAALALLSLGVLGAWPGVGVASGLLSDTASGRMARRLLPLVVGARTVMGWIALQAIRRGGFDASYVEAISIALSVLLLGGLVAGSAFVLSRWEKRRREEEALRQESEERLRLAAETARIGLWSWDLATGRLDWTPACYELFGVEPGVELTHAGFYGYVHPDDRECAQAEAERCIQAGAFYHVEFRVVRRGEVRWLASRGRTLGDERGRPYRMTGVVLDVTDRVEEAHRREALLATERAARGEMERAARLKDEFLATVSHELRSPLTAILACAQILQRRREAASVSRPLAIIERNATALNQIVADLLDTSRVLSGKLRIAVEPTCLRRVVEEAVETARPMADAKGIALGRRIERDLVVSGDPGRLQQILWNLLTNAIKFTPKGGRVEVSLREEGPCAAIEVKDTGKGIEAAFLPHAFERFRQEDASMTRRHGGLGLGLSLVNELADLHGGSVSAESAGPARGSSFTLRLPVAAAAVEGAPATGGKAGAPATRPATDPEALRGAKVLVVEDDADAREVVARILADHAAEVTSVASASEALEALRREAPDVLVSDLGMPDVDGYELIRQVRALAPNGSGSVPAIALTAFARTEDRDRSLAAGYQEHLAKPVEPWRLVATVAALRAGTGEDGPCAAGRSEARSS